MISPRASFSSNIARAASILFLTSGLEVSSTVYSRRATAATCSSVSRSPKSSTFETAESTGVIIAPELRWETGSRAHARSLDPGGTRANRREGVTGKAARADGFVRLVGQEL